ncbi:MAG TPA: hypothetical protein VFZ10_12555 [Geminicoccaceae bacterium]
MLEGQHGIRDATPIVLTADERSTLESWVRSGLNQVEIWFSILARSTLHGASFSSLAQLRAAIDAFSDAYNAAATPFQWRRATVRPKSLTSRITDLRS